jgi:hypothetical protein
MSNRPRTRRPRRSETAAQQPAQQAVAHLVAAQPSARHQYAAQGWRYGEAAACCRVDAAVLAGRPVKTLVCTVSGSLYRGATLLGQTAAEAAFGTWEISFYRPAGSTFTWVLATDQIDGPDQGYCVQVGASTTVQRLPDGTVLLGALVPPDTWQRLKITRTPLGQWTLWLQATGWQLLGKTSKPDLCHGTANYQRLVLEPGQIVSLGTVAGNGAIVKQRS